jgi:hypothetical protein
MSKNLAHYRQLFHWIGKNIEHPAPGKKHLSKEEKQKRYVKYLKESLEKGLRLPYHKAETISPGSKLSFSGNFVCFTDNRVSECEFHCKTFGQLGLGFTKAFVMRYGGRPVHYINPVRTDEFTKMLLELEKTLADIDGADSLLQLMLAHTKSLCEIRKRSNAPSRAHALGPKRSAPKRQFGVLHGKKLDHYVENEWRIVAGAFLRKKLELERAQQPLIHIPYEAGKDLITVVFPTREVLDMAYRNSVIREKLFDKAPPRPNIFELNEVAEL